MTQRSIRSKRNKYNRTRKHKKQQQAKTCSVCKRPFRQSGGDYRLATDITVGGIPMRDDTVIVRSDGSSMTAKEMKELEASL
jgi:hypothetical protein